MSGFRAISEVERVEIPGRRQLFVHSPVHGMLMRGRTLVEGSLRNGRGGSEADCQY